MKRVCMICVLIPLTSCGELILHEPEQPTAAIEVHEVEVLSEVVLPSLPMAGPNVVRSDSNPRQVVYVNFDGPTITDCACSDARSNESLVIGQVFDTNAVDFAAYTVGATKTAVLRNLRAWYSGYNVSFVTARPIGDYTMLVISPTTGPHHGVAPQNCDNTNPNDIAFVYKIGASSADTISRFAAHELGHSFGLAHVVDSTDIMQWASSGRAFERSTLDKSQAHWFGACTEGDEQDEPLMLTAALGPELPEVWNGTFTDDDGSIFEDAIEKIAAAEITKGCGLDPPRYCPDDSVTRGQMAAFLTRALTLPAADKDYFEDDDGSTFEDAINRLAAARITTGCAPARYCPTKAVTRGQMAAFLTRALGLAPASSDHFDDDDGRFYESSADRMFEAGITHGCGQRKYCGENEVTRGQMAAFLARALGL